MALFGDQLRFQARAAADLRTKQYRAMKLTGQDLVNVASLSTPAAICGVLQNKPNSGEEASIAFVGESKMYADGVVATNVPVSCNSAGGAVAAGSGDIVLGMSREAAGAAGEVIRVLLCQPFRWSGAVT